MEVCIIGGGSCSIVCARICLDHDLIPFILCKNPQPGGIWNGYPNETGVWDSMLTNTSKYVTCYSDLPWNSDDPEYVTPQQVRAYQDSYIEKHNLHQYFHFNSTVVEVSRQENGYTVKWEVEGQLNEKFFMYVVVATGRYSTQTNPLSNKEAYTGKIILGSEYREPSGFAGKKVLVVGRSFTSADIAVEALVTAENVTQIYTRPYLITKRHINGMPLDFMLNSFKSLLSPVTFHLTLESEIKSAQGVLGLFGNPSQVLPEWEVPEPPTKAYVSCVYSEEYLQAISSKRISLVKGTAEEFYSNGLVLSDGRQIEADVVVLGTGYDTNYSYLSDEIKTIIQYRSNDKVIPAILYRGIFHPDLPGMCFVGIIAGAHAGRHELPCEIGIRHMLGKLNLSDEEVWEGVRYEEYIRNDFRESGISYKHSGYLKELMRILGIVT